MIPKFNRILLLISLISLFSVTFGQSSLTSVKAEEPGSAATFPNVPFGQNNGIKAVPVRERHLNLLRSEQVFPFSVDFKNSSGQAPVGSCQSTEFEGGRVFRTGTPSNFVVSGDFNYDGLRDLVTAGDQGISVMLGDGNGHFSPPNWYSFGGVAVGIDQTDLNDDGITDLAVITNSGNAGTVVILQGDRNGNFSIVNTLQLTGIPQAIRIADFDGDDNPDIAVTQSGANSAAVFLGRGNGIFGPVTNYPVGGNGYGLVVGDFNNDSKPDMVVSSGFTNYLSFFAGHGDGNFDPRTSIPTLQGNLNLQLGDFNGDGKLDIVSVTTNFGQQSVFLGNNDGTFNILPPIDAVVRTTQIGVADVNHDGKVDLVSSGGGFAGFAYTGSSSVRLGIGDGTFGDEIVLASGFSSVSVVIDDFDVDGKPDLAIASLGKAEVVILRGDGTGKFGAPVFPTGGTQPSWSATGDFNGDGKPDLAVVDHQSKDISILLGDGNGGFSPPALVTQQVAPNVIAAADLNLDGKIDLVTGNAGNTNGNATMYAYYGNGDGTFTGVAPVSTTGSRQFRSISVAKITTDNIPDIVLAGTEATGRVVVFNGNASGVFTLKQTVVLDHPVLHVTTGDFNGDGRIDVAATTSDGVAILLNQPNGSLGTATYYRAGLNGYFLTTGDFNEDTILDLAVANDYSNGDVSILLGNGVGGFSEPTEFPAGYGPSGIAVQDLNGDNHLDLAVSDPSENVLGQNKISVLFGDGSGRFGAAIEYIGGQNPQNVVVADFDLDGRPDLAAPNYNSNNAAILKNVCFAPVAYTFPGISLGSDVVVPEPVSGSTSVMFTATLSEVSSRVVKVKYFTRSNTATGNQDYQATSGYFIFQPGETEKTLTVDVNSDAVYEYDETVDVFLGDPTNVILLNPHSSLTITDDDTPPSIAIGNVTQAEGDTGTTNFNFPVTVSATSERPIVVSYSTLGGTAASNVDFVRTSGLLTIAPRVSVANIAVPVIGDYAIEPDENFSVILSDPVGATISNALGSATITNDDIAGSIQFGSATYNVTEGGTNASLTVTRSGGSASGVSVDYSTGGGTATGDQDYRSAAGTLTFGANESSKTIPVTIIDDAIDEPDETFNVSLSNQSPGATLGTPSVAQVTIIDNDPPPNMTINDVSIQEGNSGITNAVFTVRLSATSGRTITVNYSSGDGTATAGSDYQSVSGTLTFLPSILSQTISVPINGDTNYESDEFFNIDLSEPSNVVIADGQGRGTIINDDSNPLGSNRLISINRFGTGSGDDGSQQSVMTPNGHFVAFTSSADDLVANDTNARISDVFVRDTSANVTSLVSVNQTGTGSGNGRSTAPVISPDGRFVLFESGATDLAPNDNNSFSDVYLRDMQAGTTALVSLNSAGTASASGNSSPVAISADGRYAVFISAATDVTNTPDTSVSRDIFIRDMQAGITKMVSINVSGSSPQSRDSYGLPNSVTDDGRFVLFSSDATDLTNIPNSGGKNAFVRDTVNDTTIPVSVNRTGTQMVNIIFTPSFSSDGRYVCFSSLGNDIVETDNNNRADVFVRDIQSNTASLVSINSAGTAPGNALSDQAVITPNGRFVAFASWANDLSAAQDTNGLPDIYLRDLQNQNTRLVSHNVSNSNSGNDFSALQAVSPDGRFVVFQSYATDLVTITDTNGAPDVFVGDTQTQRTALVSVNLFGTATASLGSNFASINADGTSIVFQSDASNLDVGDTNGATDIFLFHNDLGRARGTFDFDGDGKTDISIFRPNGAAGSEWWYLKSSDGGNFATQFGSPTDKLVAADYSGDGKADIAFWRPSTGEWFILRSEDSSFYAFPFGGSGDIPAPADYDGDGKADAAVFRPSTATWFIQNSGGGTTIQTFGSAGDVPVVGDYDGDGKADLAIFRPTGATGSEWWYLKSSDGGNYATQFGTPTDKTVPGDYTGDGKTDVAFWRPSTGEWYILRSEDSSFYAFPFGSNGDIPVPGDYDGDGKTDAGVFRPSNSTWFVNKSTGGTIIQQFGSASDVPVPNEFVR